MCCLSDIVCELFDEIILGLVVILLLNVMDVLLVGVGSLLDTPCMFFQRVCVCVLPVIPVCI